MKVIDLVNMLNEIGYDENTELTFSCVDKDRGESYCIDFDRITYGEELTGLSYSNDAIDIGIDVDSSREYIQTKAETMVDDLIDDLQEILKKHRPWS